MFESCRNLTDHNIFSIKLCNNTWEFPEQFFLSHAAARRQSTVKRLISIQNNCLTKGQENLLPNPNITVFFLKSIIPDMSEEQTNFSNMSKPWVNSFTKVLTSLVRVQKYMPCIRCQKHYQNLVPGGKALKGNARIRRSRERGRRIGSSFLLPRASIASTLNEFWKVSFNKFHHITLKLYVDQNSPVSSSVRNFVSKRKA